MTTSSTSAGGIRVRGSATVEELAAVIAALARANVRRDVEPAQSSYARWRSGRLAVLRAASTP